MHEALRHAGGTTRAGSPLTHVPPPIASPFGSASYVEGDSIRAIDVGGPAPPPERTAFLDGIQRYAVEGRFGLVPVVRGYVAAATMRREGDRLRVADHEAEELIVVPVERLAPDQREALADTGIPLMDCEAGERPHPIVDVQLAARAIERRREELEASVATALLASDPECWLVVDGALGGLAHLLDDGPRVLGLIKSHETQFLDGPDLEIAVTLPEGYRSSVFARRLGERSPVYTWYLRFRPWEDRDLLHGLVRIERPATDAALTEATAVSRWLLTERAPLSAPDGRWDRLLYPIHQVETFLRAQAGGW